MLAQPRTAELSVPSHAMNPNACFALAPQHGRKAITMTSLELVEFINENRKAHAEAADAAFPSPGFAKLVHSDFMKKVPEVLGRGVGKISDTYTHPQNCQQYPYYRFSKREACLMAMSYSYELQAKVFDRMTTLETEQALSLPNFDDPVAAARAWADAKEAQQVATFALELAAPKVKFVDRFVDATGLETFRQVAKLLHANEARFREFLIEQRIVYYLDKRLMPYQSHIDAGRFEIRAGLARHNDHAYTSAKFTPKGVEWVVRKWAQKDQTEMKVRNA